VLTPLGAGPETRDVPRADGMGDRFLDLKGLKCPLPAIKTRQALARMEAGARLTVICTDPLATLDIPNVVRETGDRLEALDSTDRVSTFRIVKL
jgi:tRNA 2-thiouridine synthesizing protein A